MRSHNHGLSTALTYIDQSQNIHKLARFFISGNQTWTSNDLREPSPQWIVLCTYYPWTWNWIKFGNSLLKIQIKCVCYVISFSQTILIFTKGEIDQSDKANPGACAWCGPACLQFISGRNKSSLMEHLSSVTLPWSLLVTGIWNTPRSHNAHGGRESTTQLCQKSYKFQIFTVISKQNWTQLWGMFTDFICNEIY